MLPIKRSNCKRMIVCAMLVLMILCTYIPFPAGADENIPYAQARDPMVRVWLTRLGLTDRLDLTLISPYSLSNQEGLELHLQAGSEIAVLLREGGIYLYYDQLSVRVGETLLLERTSLNDEGKSGFYRTNFPALYEGDLKLDISDGKLRPVLTIHVEDYLLGVVPYEMSEAFPLEALKAQAVAARTYVLRKQNSDAAYDVVDNTNDQVFKGYMEGSPRTEQAVAQTYGVCGFYKDKLAQCYYSASNGGQMELVESVWPTDEDFGYYTFGEDPYDVENPASVVRTFEIQKEYQDDAPQGLREMLARLLADILTQRGFDASWESLRIDQVHSVSVDAPVKENSKLMNMLTIQLNISGRNRYEIVPIVDTDPEEVSLFLVEASPQPVVASQTTLAPAATVTPAPSPKIAYGPYMPIEETITLNVPIFPTAEDAFGMDISSNYDNEIWTVVETDTAFVLESRRYGHGVGMSQRGAQVMAADYGMSYRDILGFYYPGMKLMRYPQQSVIFNEPAEALSQTAGPAASPTPKPTLMPATMEAEEGEWFALVSEITEDSSLNLRAEPHLSADILMRLYKNQRLLVVEKCAQEGWVKVRTDVTEGYVMESFLSKEK